MATSTIQPGAAIRHPIILCALCVWFLNDHLLKGNGPGWITGRLSDITCLMVVPLMPVAVIELWQSREGRKWEPSHWVLVVSVILTGAVMATINTIDIAAWAYRHGLAALQWPFLQAITLLWHGKLAPWRLVQLTMDPTDLWTLPALIVPVWVAVERPKGGSWKNSPRA
jgi:hypothetical protein